MIPYSVSFCETFSYLCKVYENTFNKKAGNSGLMETLKYKIIKSSILNTAKFSKIW
jgi:hypothetical protein